MNSFETLNSINCNGHTEKKNGLTYLSWAWAWAEVKKAFPDAEYIIYENADGWNYHTDGRTAWVKTGVKIQGLEHIEYLPVMDFRNASIPLEKITSFDVNKAIQRSLTKACARHGLGLYIYAGEDLPEDSEGYATDTKPSPKKTPEPQFTEISDGAEVEGIPCCEDCGTPFVETQDPKTGKPISPAEQKQLAIKLRGAAICKKCAAKRKLANG